MGDEDVGNLGQSGQTSSTGISWTWDFVGQWKRQRCRAAQDPQGVYGPENAVFQKQKKKKEREKYTSGPIYWNVPVLVNNGTFLMYQYCLKMWHLRSLERAGVIQKLTILEHKNGLVLSNTHVPVSGTSSIRFPKKARKGVFFKSWESENVHFQEKGEVFVKADLKVWAQTCLGIKFGIK